MRPILLLITLFLLCNCEGVPRQYESATGRYLISTVDSGDIKTKIRAVNNSGILYTRGYKLGSKVWLEPGTHRLILESTRPGEGKLDIFHKPLSLVVKKGYRYNLVVVEEEGSLKIQVNEIRSPQNE